MAFNIKNEDTVDVAREIAAKTGESIAAVFDVAVRERAARIATDREARIDRALRVANDIASRLGPSVMDIDDLYDERGLPK